MKNQVEAPMQIYLLSIDATEFENNIEKLRDNRHIKNFHCPEGRGWICNFSLEIDKLEVKVQAYVAGNPYGRYKNKVRIQVYIPIILPFKDVISLLKSIFQETYDEQIIFVYVEEKSLAHKKILWKLTLKEIIELFARLYFSYYPLIYAQEVLYNIKNFIENLKETEYKRYLYDILLGDLGRKIYDFLEKKRENAHAETIRHYRFEPILYTSDTNKILTYRNLIYLLSMTDNIMRRYYYYFLGDINKADSLTYYKSLKFVSEELLKNHEKNEEEKLFGELLKSLKSQIKSIDEFYKGLLVVLNNNILDIHKEI